MSQHAKYLGKSTGALGNYYQHLANDLTAFSQPGFRSHE